MATDWSSKPKRYAESVSAHQQLGLKLGQQTQLENEMFLHRGSKDSGDSDSESNSESDGDAEVDENGAPVEFSRHGGKSPGQVVLQVERQWEDMDDY